MSSENTKQRTWRKARRPALWIALFIGAIAAAVLTKSA